MKKLLTMLAIALVAGVASADTVLEDDFSTFAPFDPASNPVNIWDDNSGGGTTEKWLTAGASTSGSGELWLQTGGGGQSRGIAYVLDPTQTAGMVADNYTVSIDVLNQYNNATFEFFAYEGVRDDTGTANSYALDLLSALNADLTHITLGAGSLTLLDSNTWSAGSGVSGTLELNFAYDGTDDIVIVMNQRTPDGWMKRTTLDNFAVTNTIPEPATLALFGAVGAGMLFIRRRNK